MFKNVPLQVLPDNDILLLIANDNLGILVSSRRERCPCVQCLLDFVGHYIVEPQVEWETLLLEWPAGYEPLRHFFFLLFHSVDHFSSN